ncbi:mitochondrial tricarboxylate transporter [Martensiomyces pterosporus]|nr:mitochondrial tricarboxylate transporter [Martensiomyces pterosporus]
MAPQKKDSPTHSLLAGTIAGAVEGAITYPTELVKTKVQLQGSKQYALQGGHIYKGPIDCVKTTVKTQGIQGLYRGLTPMLIGNAAKAGVRFLTYDTIKAKLRREDGKLTMPRMMLAGMCAGVVEGGTVVAPSETIKTRLIHDQCMPKPKYKGVVDCVRTAVTTEGVSGIYRGVVPVMARQGANSCVRFASYDTLKQLLISQTGLRELPFMYSFGLGMAAGTITVYATMPFDVVKTRMQSLSARLEYKGSFHCAWRVVSEEGVSALWKGATPRLSRLMFSGAIVFAVYEEVMKRLR